ncbi:GHMP kinase family protein [Klebsormidium nitens]|uniref:GHMP kinase family protein n=1 Tax=Klebsormidium nitens TaxID=105231 RepID=A0A1Y1ISG6_KLENI|nr:GHMP kinase family protein [Klebsormidium nitens]|eukprot:GAQ91706.1 GHMP kinase family protein [Klebsormidium nitens]
MAAHIVEKAHARVGFLGNPSDGYFGKTISFLLQNFSATVRLEPSDTLRFVPSLEHDPQEFLSLEALAVRARTEGYYGGIRLLMAICARFHQYCSEKHINLPPKGNFTLAYDTNIPRQAGLSGSSAIICATLSCLMRFYEVEDRIPWDDRPSLILSAEADLGITAGLQDRVIQVYGGLVYMDFEREHLAKTGNGIYTPLDPALLPALQLIYARNPSDSGKVHSTVKKRWLEGDLGIRTAMEEVASIAEEGREALEKGDHKAIAELMNRNFDLRRQMFGDEALGAMNIDMVMTARSVGAAAKFTGSGGAVVAFCPQGSDQVKRLSEACDKKGFTMAPIQVAPSNVQGDNVVAMGEVCKSFVDRDTGA